jgi:CDP-6-deoxy-D-xylo-4-hexulose-3-dehydrase
MKPIKLVQDTIDNKDIDQLIEWLKTYPRLTKDKLTVELENKFANWVGSKYSVFVNSGSSANLLMLYACKISGILKSGDKVLVPSLSWATDLAPILQLDLKPILVDCNLENLSIDLNNLEKLISEHQPKVLLLVSVLGLSPDMDMIVEICNKHNITLLEDNCESQGTKFNNKKLGTFGKMASFSTYFGHIMSTIEGGFITTDDEKIYELLKMLRSHGWVKDSSLWVKEKLAKEWKTSEFNQLYTFYAPGFNLRSTDLQAFIGIKQLDKVDKMIEQRNKNFQLFKQLLKDKTWFPKEHSLSFTSSFCIPIIFKTKENKENAIKEFLENDIEIRPLIAGSMGKQPMYVIRYGELSLPNCDIIDERGMYIPNHPLLTEDEIKLMCEIVIKNDK